MKLIDTYNNIIVSGMAGTWASWSVGECVTKTLHRITKSSRLIDVYIELAHLERCVPKTLLTFSFLIL